MNPTVEQIVQALHALVCAAVSHTKETALSARVAVARLRLLEAESSTRAGDGPLDALLTDPVGAAYQQAIRTLGEYLFVMDGSTTFMRYASELLLDMSPGDFAERANIIDQAWNSVGQGQDRWVAF